MIKKVYNQEQMLKIISENPGISSTKIAGKMNISRVTSFTYLKELLRLQKIQVQDKGRATKYFLSSNSQIAKDISSNNSEVFNEGKIMLIKQEIQFSLTEEYDEIVDIEEIDYEFEQYCMYIDNDMVIRKGFDAFVAWCIDPRHGHKDRILQKARQYIEILLHIKAGRKKHGFFDASETVRSILEPEMKSEFNKFLFFTPSRISTEFGASRTAIELRYGKINNRSMLEAAIEKVIDSIRNFVSKYDIDAYIIAPPSIMNREVQFRDILKKKLNLNISYIFTEKRAMAEIGIMPQKEIRGKNKKTERINNAMKSMYIDIPADIMAKKHILILDDTFTTGATPNAIAIKLREVGYIGDITIITVCGSFVFNEYSFDEEI